MTDIQNPTNGKKEIRLTAADECDSETKAVRSVSIVQQLKD